MKFQLLTLVILACMICNFADAQRTKMRYKINFRHSIEPVVTYYRGFNLEQELGSSGDIRKISSGETQSGSMHDYMQFGVNYAFSLTYRLSIVSGIQFSNPALRTDSNTALKIASIQEQHIGIVDQSGVVVRRQYYEIPTLMRYTITSANVCKSFVEFGVTHQFYRHSKANELGANLRARKFSFVEDQEKYHATAQLNIGGEFMIAGVLPAFTQLNMNYQLDPMQQFDRIDRNIAIGFTSGVRLRF